MESKCLEYLGYISNSGYGLDYDPKTKKTVLAHRLAFRISFGYLPEVVMHTCDNPKCVNPEHLKAGTQKDNIRDCIKKGRKASNQKLSLSDCKRIRESPLSSRVLAAHYKVNQKTICNIKNFKHSYLDISGKGGTCGS